MMTKNENTNDRLRKLNIGFIGVTVVLMAILPFLIDDYWQHIMVVTLYYVIMAASWNLLSGYTGQFSLSHQTFAALGGYASGLMIYHLQVPIWVGFVSAIFVTAGVGFLLGFLVLKMRGIYLAVATWAFSESTRLAFAAFYKFTKGEQGLLMPGLFDSLAPQRYYYLFLGLAIVLLGLMYAVIRSPIGFYIRAIKDDELAARAMGVNTIKWKLFIMTFASAVAGIAGFFYAHYITVLSPSIMSFNEIGKIVIMVVFGGLGTFIGPIIGAPAIVIINEFTRDYGQWNMVFYSAAVIIIMLLYRDGIAALLQGLIKKLFKVLKVVN